MCIAQCRYRDVHNPLQLVYYSVHCIVMYLVPVVIMVAVYSVVTFTLVTRKLPGAVISSTRSAQERAKRKCGFSLLSGRCSERRVSTTVMGCGAHSVALRSSQGDAVKDACLLL
ncbi:hypothetical protein ACOMHN_003516 [Nucella lapillus]